MELTCYELWDNHGLQIVPAAPGREWMGSHANHCLPMLIANQSGWTIINNAWFRVRWNGGDDNYGLNFEFRDQQIADVYTQALTTGSGVIPGQPAFPKSTFGQGVLTWTLPFLFRTPPGYNLLVRGPANHPKHGITPLEGVVETDWTPAPFTMNWKITKPNKWVTFEQGEPICMVVPQRRGELEQFRPRIRPLAEADPDLRRQFENWRDGVKTNPPRSGYQLDYLKGVRPDGTPAPEHQTRLRLHNPE
ncbi:DUF6065 family protein [Mycobacterium sp. 94-17]|uniref:DUF6065 family protein n=1 Tax=Mycobacterium sp. 94-17 TaxID=2986147 RepID=UPI002D1F2A8F|nr:DUF6065 family protein [Mycobacterium sp. 94-17]MEB4212323.1 DUF6065 family protein [Mycobacterium sp. 94-17]